MEDRDTEIEKLKKELANLKKDPRELILASRIREREEEYQHRLLELELASEGIIPVGIAPEAKAHGGKEFTALMKEVEVDEILPVAEKVHKDGYAIIQDFLTKNELEVVRKKWLLFSSVQPPCLKTLTMTDMRESKLPTSTTYSQSQIVWTRLPHCLGLEQ